MPIRKNESVLEFLLKRLESLKTSMPVNVRIVVLTCPRSIEILKQRVPQSAGVEFFVGPEDDVLERFYLASLHYAADIIIRVTADNPFTSLEHLQSILDYHMHRSADLSRYVKLPLGAGVEVVSAQALHRAWRGAYSPYQREHVTPYIYEHPNAFSIEELSPEDACQRPDVRLTIDTYEDLCVAQRILLRHTHASKLSEIIEYYDRECVTVPTPAE